MIINIATFDLLLRDRGMTQKALAQRARLGTKTIGRIRRGEELRITNATKIAEALGVSLDELQLPPSEKLQERAGKKSGLNRLVADLSSQSLTALTMSALRYKVPEKSILEVGPYLFMILAELSLKRRRDKLEAWKDAALAAMESGPLNHSPYSIEGIVEDIWELYNEELASIEQRDLTGVSSSVHPEAQANESHDHAFRSLLEDLAREAACPLIYGPQSVYDYVPRSCWTHKQAIAEFLNPEEEDLPYDADAFFLIECGRIPLRDMPEELLASGTGADRRAWVENHPNYWPVLSSIGDTDEVIESEEPELGSESENGGSNA